ncbi:hypothetical protein ACN265_32050 [Micromonospora sp. WMMD730]|uniref:hypothetical protein n=1 Tax=Micromonospora sp. WMMD730 TaxID=3404128 RepID=UPI003B940A2B
MTTPPSRDVWSPVVYGRTLHADFWWRAVPAGVPRRGWLTDVVHASVNNGRRIATAPRFALARTDDWVLAGVACAAAEISTDFSHQGLRPLYTFVGWAGPADAATEIPPLHRWHAQWRTWTRDSYDRWLRDVWTLPSRQLQQPRDSGPEQAGWTSPEEELGEQPAPERSYPAEPGTVWLLPATAGPGLWEQGRLGTAPMRLVTGWEKAGHALLAGTTHITAADVDLPRRRPLPTARTATPPPPPPQEPSTAPPQAETRPVQRPHCLRRTAARIPILKRLFGKGEPRHTRPHGGPPDTTANYAVPLAAVGQHVRETPAPPMDDHAARAQFDAHPDFAEPEQPEDRPR